ncbi:MAG: hypothetical protein DRG87_00705 [Deltaproteobacteria bacterium]|nr:MAG: hypothetical protein DRG87_00705 [Deltaproteobacteria bacterium]
MRLIGESKASNVVIYYGRAWRRAASDYKGKGYAGSSQDPAEVMEMGGLKPLKLSVPVFRW